MLQYGGYDPAYMRAPKLGQGHDFWWLNVRISVKRAEVLVNFFNGLERHQRGADGIEGRGMIQRLLRFVVHSADLGVGKKEA